LHSTNTNLYHKTEILIFTQLRTFDPS
jgi:hypothetical protein